MSRTYTFVRAGAINTLKMELTFNTIEKGQYEQVSEFIINMYAHHLKRYYTEKGDEGYRKFASEKELEKRCKKGNKIFLVKENEELVGLIEFDSKKLHQFFIVDEFRGRGYGRMAINWLKKYFKQQKLGKSLLVESSPNSYMAFEKMGFEPISEETEVGEKVSKKMKLTV